MNPGDIDKELDRLWAKVSTARASSDDLPAPAFPAGGTAFDISLDAAALLKKQHRQQAESWAQLLEAKERALRLTLERQAVLEAEAQSLRQRLKAGESLVFGEVLEARTKLEAGVKSISDERQRFDEERRSLQALLEGTRDRLAAEAKRADELQRQWEKRERQHLEELRSFQEQCSVLQEGSVRSEEQARSVSGGLKEAKNALEKTLSELLAERQARQESERERAEALGKVDEIQKHFNELSKLWEEERTQWRELWDRERSTWETQRKEFSSWEESLRKEREAFHSELQEKERSQVEFVAKINESLRQSTETSTRLASAMKLLRGLAGPAHTAEGGASFNWRRAAAGALAAALLAGGGWGLWSYARRPHFKLAVSQSVALENPTSLAHDGERLWVSEWDGALRSFDPKDFSAFDPVRAKVSEPYRPVALAAGADYLWALDSAQARVVGHRAGRPAEILKTRPAPGPAPSAAATDGDFLWIYDAANAALYRQDAEGKSSRSMTLPDFIPSAMAWVDGALWAFDPRSRELAILDPSAERVAVRGRFRFDSPVLGISGGKGALWILAGPDEGRPGFALQKFEY